MVNVENHNGTTLAFVSEMVASYNRANADHGDAPTESGWGVDGIDGPYSTREEACNAVGVDPDDKDWDYL